MDKAKLSFPPQPENYYRGVIRKCSVSALKIECFSFFPFGYALVSMIQLVVN